MTTTTTTTTSALDLLGAAAENLNGFADTTDTTANSSGVLGYINIYPSRGNGLGRIALQFNVQLMANKGRHVAIATRMSDEIGYMPELRTMIRVHSSSKPSDSMELEGYSDVVLAELPEELLEALKASTPKLAKAKANKLGTVRVSLDTEIQLVDESWVQIGSSNIYENTPTRIKFVTDLLVKDYLDKQAGESKPLVCEYEFHDHTVTAVEIK